MKKKLLIIKLMIGILIIGNVSAEAETVSLKELVDEALQNNPEIKAEKGKWEAAKASVKRAASFDDPMLSVEFNEIPDSSINPGASMERMYSITQEFPFPGKLGLMSNMADKEAAMMHEVYRGREKDVILEVKAAYYDYYMIHKSIEVSLETKEILHHLSKMAEARYATGLVSQWDVLKAQIELSQLANEIIILNQEKESARARINRLINKPVESPLGDPGAIEDNRTPPTLESLEDIALQQRPEIEGMKRAIEREDSALSLARRGYYPDFMVKLGQVERDKSADGWMAEFGVRVPLWFSTKQDNAVRESVSRQDAAKNGYESMKNMVSLEIKEALVKIISARSLVDLHKSTHIPQAEQALRGAQAAYETGRVDFFALMESWKTLKGYKLDYYKSLASMEQAWAELERAVGKELP